MRPSKLGKKPLLNSQSRAVRIDWLAPPYFALHLWGSFPSISMLTVCWLRPTSLRHMRATIQSDFITIFLRWLSISHAQSCAVVPHHQNKIFHYSIAVFLLSIAALYRPRHGVTLSWALSFCVYALRLQWRLLVLAFCFP